MRRYRDSFIGEVKRARKKEGLSFSQLGVRFNVPSNTIRNWCYSLGSSRTETIVRNNEQKRHYFKRSEVSVVPNKINEKRARFLAGVLYGCEGSKYPNTCGIHFSNSDPNLILTFLNLLRKAFVLDESRLSVHLQVHTTHNYQLLQNYWSELLSIPESRFIKPTIKEPKGGKHRTDYRGTCTLRYGDYRIQLKLMGIFEKFTRKFALSS